MQPRSVRYLIILEEKMYPIIFQYGFITIGGYGVMLGIGFYLAFMLLEREFKFRGIDPELAYKILLAAIPCGIVGSKLFHILEHMDEFLANPKDMILSGAGLSAYGGYVLGIIVCAYIIKKNNESIIKVFDAVTPSMAFGYCFGRFGCQVAGDGCYGEVIKSHMLFGFTGTAYPNGIVPTSSYVYPTPLFEVFFSFFLVGLLLQLRKRDWVPGRLFFLYLILSGMARLLIEMIRTNPSLIFSLTQAQVVSIVSILIGLVGWIYSGRQQQQAV
jgi:phosphatidylglycerol:prolipoprotein diacylglycerol transferase